MTKVSSLLNVDYSKFSNTFELEDYIRELRKELRLATIRNNYLVNEEERMYMKELNGQTIIVQTCDKLHPTDILQPNGTPHEITATIDPAKFPALCIIPPYEQIKYFKKIFSKLIIDNELPNLYGSFEKQKNGNIHFHGITYIYSNQELSFNLERLISSYLTDRPYRRNAKFKNTQCKPIRTTIEQWFQYMNKESDDFIQYNLLKNSLEI